MSAIFPVNGLDANTETVYIMKKKLAAFTKSIWIAYKLIYDTIPEKENALKNIINPIGIVDFIH